MPRSKLDSIDIVKLPHHIVGPEERIDEKDTPNLTTKMSWAVFDVLTNEVAQFDADGGHFASLPGHRYLVIVRFSDPRGVEKMTLDGSGAFRCVTEPDRNGQEHEPALALKISIPHQEFGNTGKAPTLQDLIVVMKPDIGAFDYFRLSAGYRFFNETNEKLEYFAYSGLMTFSATGVNSKGYSITGSLTTSPG